MNGKRLPGELEFTIPPALLGHALHFLSLQVTPLSSLISGQPWLLSPRPGQANPCGGKQASFRRTWALLIKLATNRKAEGLSFVDPELDRNRTPQLCVVTTSHC